MHRTVALYLAHTETLEEGMVKYMKLVTKKKEKQIQAKLNEAYGEAQKEYMKNYLAKRLLRQRIRKLISQNEKALAEWDAHMMPKAMFEQQINTYEEMLELVDSVWNEVEINVK